MIKNHFKIAFRNLIRQKAYSAINIGGLALGMSVALLIGLWIHDELSFNKYHENYDHVAKVYRNTPWGGGQEVETNSVHTTGLGTVLQSAYHSHFERIAMVRARVEERVVAAGEHKFTQSGYFMQSEGPNLLTLKMRSGSRAGLADMNSILLSESLAQKLFGEADPINQVLRMDARWDLKITGVYEDLPQNSEFHQASWFAPLDLYLDGWAHLNVWDNYNMYIYAQIHPETTFEKASAAIKDAMLAHVENSEPQLFLHPMSRWRLHSEFENGVNVISDNLKIVWSYGVIGAFVLLLACINFMNLSTARSEKRALEIGVRKTIGSVRSHLIFQFLSESLLIVLFAFGLSLVLVEFALPWFGQAAGKSLNLPWTNANFWLTSISFILITALLAGSYPAFYLSAFNPVNALKGTFRAGRLSLIPRNSLVVFQFTISIALIIGTLVIDQHIEYVKERPVGYTREGLIMLRPGSPEYRGKYGVLRNEFIKTGTVYEMAESSYSITNTLGWNGGFDWPGRAQDFDPSFNTIYVTHEYGKTIGWQFVDGRDFSREFPSDFSGVVINESALEVLGLKNPVGETISWAPGWQSKANYKILGVVKDVIKGSPFQPTHPAITFLSGNDLNWLYIRIHPDVSAREALPKIATAFNRIIPSAPFDYQFVDDVYAAKFKAEEQVGRLAGFFAVLAIFISCLGLFGLAAFVAEKRTKEIGVRKVLGASVPGLVGLLSSDLLKLVAIANVIAWPIAWYTMNYWLQNYDYRIEIGWGLFIVAGVLAVVIALMTVSTQAVKAALANPVESLKYE